LQYALYTRYVSVKDYDVWECARIGSKQPELVFSLPLPGTLGDGRTVYFDVVVTAISCVMISDGCVFFVGDSVSSNTISQLFCENDPDLPSNISESAKGLKVSDGECPTFVTYKNINFAGAVEAIDF